VQFRRRHALQLHVSPAFLGDRLMGLAGVLVAVAAAELVAPSLWPHLPQLVWGVLLLIALGLAVVGFLTPPKPRRRRRRGPTYRDAEKAVDLATSSGVPLADKDNSNEAH
jgi:hypothetical protein